jgi:hypothetical protein
VDKIVAVMLVASAVFSVVCWVVLWRSTDHVVSKVLWTFIAAMPAVGPVLFAALHDPPPVQAEIDRAAGGWDVVPDMSHGGTPDHQP